MSARKGRDPYADVRRRMRRAGDLLARGRAELRAAAARLERDPDYRRSVRLQGERRPAAESLTLAFWLHDCVLSVLEGPDGLDAFPEFLRVDSAPGSAERTLAEFVETDTRERAERAVRARRAA